MIEMEIKDGVVIVKSIVFRLVGKRKRCLVRVIEYGIRESEGMERGK